MKKKRSLALLVAVLLVGCALISVAHFGTGQTSVSSQAQILSYSWYTAPSNTVIAESPGDLVAVGEVQNVGSSVIGYAIVGGEAYNSTGQMVASNEARALVYGILPGQKAPFYLDFAAEDSVTQDQSWVSSVTNVTVFVAYVNLTDTAPYEGLQIQQGSTSSSEKSGTFTVNGSVKNTGDETTGPVWVVATFYNTAGTVIALNYTGILTNSLAPGSSASFTATPTDNSPALSSQITNYSLTIQYQPLATSASPAASSPSVGSSSSTASPLTSTANSLRLNSVYFYVGAFMVIVVAIAVILLLLRKRHREPPLPPPPPPPPIECLRSVLEDFIG